MKRPREEKIPSDDEEDAATAQEETNVTQGEEPSSKKKLRSKQNDMSHDFSSKEISRLQENEAVFHSSLFRLQITELLKEVSIKQKLRQRIQGAVETLTQLVQALPVGKEHKIMDRKWLQASGIKVPVVEKPSLVKGNFQFQPPSSVKVVGSFALNTVVKPNVDVCLALEIPKSCFQTKDYLNHRCIRKQALYLAFVAIRLRKKKQVESLKFSYLSGNPMKPVLVATVKGKDSKNVNVQLQTTIESDTFKLSRFEVTKNNVRPKWYLEKSSGAEEEESDASSLPPTQFYNMSIAHDMCHAANEAFLHKTLAGSEGLRQGIMLLKVWLRQRQLLGGWGLFSDELITCFVVSLVLKKKVNKLMNNYQVFRTTLLNLARANWHEEPPSLTENIDSSKVEAFTSAFPCVFVDVTGHVNLAYMISNSIFQRVKGEAQRSISSLGKSNQRSFDVLFMTQMSFPRTFDTIFHIAINAKVLDSANEKIDKLQMSAMDCGGQQSLALQSHVEDLLSKALDTRVTLVQAKPRQSEMWELSDEPYVYDDDSHVTFGLCLNPAGAFSVLSKGPAADSEDAAEFRRFWGEKSEMRRFKDGTIHEAVLWTSSSLQSERRLVCKKIVQHILNRHCGIEKSAVYFVGSQLDSLLHANLTEKLKSKEQGTGEEQSMAVIHAFDDVNRALRSLTSLPLSIHSVQGSHPVFRHADVFPPMPAASESSGNKIVKDAMVPEEKKSIPPYIPALRVICMLEGSGKWPEDKDAIKAMKALLHVKMGDELKKKHLLPVSISQTYVDVLKSGYVFRLELANTREIAVLRTVTTDDGMVKFRNTKEAVTLEKEIITLPHHTHLLHGIQQEHPVFSAVVRLCKRWITAQMLWTFLTEEAMELIVAQLFIDPHPHSPPSSLSSGLLRFLHLLTTFNWQADPLLVNLNKEFSDEDLSSIPKDFTKHRATLPSMCIATPQDKTGTKWTQDLPTVAILQRLIIVARESLKVLENQVMSGSPSSDFKLIFRPPFEHFDVVIHLLKKVNVLSHQAVDSKSGIPLMSCSESVKPDKPFPVVEFNVCLKFVEDLRGSFGDFAMFFYDPYGGDSIGMVWKHQALESKEFKPSNFFCRKPAVDENEKFSLDATKDCILDDIRILGGGIVEAIQSTNMETNMK